nr:MAG TPA: hypothetical protein [Inoviridae sp.]
MFTLSLTSHNDFSDYVTIRSAVKSPQAPRKNLHIIRRYAKLIY